MRLLCFPYAGASAMAYQRWRRQVPDWLDVRPVELPGRGSLMAAPLISRWDELLDFLVQEIAADVHPPYALFGHSMGALVAFEMAHRLRGLGLPAGNALIVSGTDAPACRNNGRFLHQETDAQLRAEMQRLDGTDQAVFADDELMALTLPVLRADFQLCGHYVRHDRPPLAMPVHVLAGESDETTPETLAAWRQETSGVFTLDYFDGGHFFIQNQQAQVLAAVCRHLGHADSLAA